MSVVYQRGAAGSSVAFAALCPRRVLLKPGAGARGCTSASACWTPEAAQGSQGTASRGRAEARMTLASRKAGGWPAPLPSRPLDRLLAPLDPRGSPPQRHQRRPAQYPLPCLGSSTPSFPSTPTPTPNTIFTITLIVTYTFPPPAVCLFRPDFLRLRRATNTSAQTHCA